MISKGFLLFFFFLRMVRPHDGTTPHSYSINYREPSCKILMDENTTQIYMAITIHMLMNFFFGWGVVGSEHAYKTLIVINKHYGSKEKYTYSYDYISCN